MNISFKKLKYTHEQKLKTSGYSSNFLQEFSTVNNHLSLFQPINCFQLIYRAYRLMKDRAFRWCIDSTRTERHESNKWNFVPDGKKDIAVERTGTPVSSHDRFPLPSITVHFLSLQRSRVRQR